MSRFDPSCIDVEDFLECLDIRNVERATEKEVRFCVSPEVRILTRDLIWVDAGSLLVGDELWAFDENRKLGERDRRIRRAVVENVERRILPCSKVHLDDGTSQVVSDDHMWLADPSRKHPKWRKTTKLYSGLKLLRIFEVWDMNIEYESGWIAGIFDGEGNIAQRGGRIAIQVAQNEGRVLDNLRKYLVQFGWEFYEYKQGSGYPDSTCRSIRIKGGLSEMLKFLGTHRPERLLAKYDLEGIQMRRISSPRVVAVESVGKQEVVALGTSTRTFFSDGIASHNSCPYPAHVKGDETPSAYMNLQTSGFFCHSCKAKGNAVSVTADILGVSPIAAIRMLKQRYSPAGIDPDSRSMVEEIRKILHKEPQAKRLNNPLPESVLEAYKIDWTVAQHQHHAGWASYIFARGFSVKTLTEWQFGYSDKFRRITLPIRDEQGRLVGIKARSWAENHNPKYLNLRDDENGVEPYLKNDIVFALDRVPADADTLIVAEGELNAIVMHELGYRNTVAINGSYFGERQIRLIKHRAEKVILFFDSDSAGFEATQAVADVLLPFVFVDVVPDHIGDPAEMHPYSVKRCLNEACGYMEVALARS